MKWVIGAIIGLAALLAVVVVIGMLLPARHVAAVRIDIGQPPDRVFDAIMDVEGATAWRSGLTSVEILEPGEHLRWRETTGFGPLVMVREETVPPGRLVTRIDDPDQPFEGRWTYDLAGHGSGTTLTLTEEGVVHNPLFRFMSRFVFGHYRTLETYARDLSRHFGESVEPVRVAGE